MNASLKFFKNLFAGPGPGPHPDGSRSSRLKLRSEKGQSMAELGIILPVLLLMLLGVFEVGWALRGYLVLVNVNREAARFAARGVYLDFSEKDDSSLVGYEKVYTHTLDSLSRQLALDFESAAPNTSMIVTYYTVEPDNFNCSGDPTCRSGGLFDCSRFAYENRDAGNYLPGEMLNEIEYPLLVPPPGALGPPSYYNTYLAIANTTPVTAYHYHVGSPAHLSRIDPADKVEEVRANNNEINCQLVQKGLPPVDSNVVVVEQVYLQKQLIGIPIVTSFVPDPVPFYTHTAMRVTADLRERKEDDDAVCEVLPIIIPSSKVSGRRQGDDVTITIENNADVPGNFSYLHWDSTSNQSDVTLGEELLDSGRASNYVEPDSNPQDTRLNIGDWVESEPGTHASTHVTGALNQQIAGQEILYFPVWNDSDCVPGPCTGAEQQGSNAKFQVFTFVAMRLKSTSYTGSPKSVTFEFSHFAPDICLGDDRP